MPDNLEQRRKRLAFRARHRGMKELDLLIGSFAERHLAAFSPDQLDRFEALLDLPEPLMYGWLVGGEAPPDDLDNDVLTLLLNFKYLPQRLD